MMRRATCYHAVREAAAAGLAIAAIVLTVSILAAFALYERDNAASLRKEKEKTERTLYFQRITLAHRELTANFTNPARAEELLEACPIQQRGWEWHYLNRLWQIEPVVLRDPGSEEFHSVAFSPDGQHVAAACRRRDGQGLGPEDRPGSHPPWSRKVCLRRGV